MSFVQQEMFISVKYFALEGAHEAQERTQAPLQTNLIAMTSQAEEVKEWFYFPETTQDPQDLSGE